MRKSAYGFTIVELLIAIVVIAILAAIAIVAYNGVMDRAKNAQITSALNAYEKHLHSNYVEYGRIQQTSFSGMVSCLGEITDYPASDTFAAGACSVTKSTGATWHSWNSIFADEARERLSVLPPIPLPEVDDGLRINRGAWVVIEGDGTYRIEMVVADNKTCPSGTTEVERVANVYRWCEKYVELQ